jgi:antagonist of KipI
MTEETAAVEVIKPGAFTTLQDLGRPGYQHLGVPVGGAMDEVSHRLANALVGNPASSPTLEITLLGPTLRFEADALVACCGADLSMTIDGQAVPRTTAARVPAGAVLQFGRRVAGLRAYLALRGRLAVDPVMGSASTYARGGFGGHHGRALRKGDTLLLRTSDPSPPQRSAGAISAETSLLASLGDPGPIRVLRGREWAEFTGAAQAAWLGEGWRIGAQSERMGYRLEGPALDRIAARDILSEAVTFGTVQVPPDGQPIVLMADRQTTGGYPRIAQVATVDLPRLAQCAPGEYLRFAEIGIDTAQRLLIRRSHLFDDL